MCYHESRSVEKTYWIAHHLDYLDVFDYERSEYGRKAVIAESVRQSPRTQAAVDSKRISMPARSNRLRHGKCILLGSG
ncbi:hypothetical protein AB9M62_48100 [Bacillales bacterium AN1005]